MSNQESADNEHISWNRGSDYKPCSIDVTDLGYGRKERWKVRRFAERKHLLNSRKTCASVFDQDPAQDQ